MAKAVLQSNIQASDAGLTVAAGATVTIRNSDTLGLATLYTTRAGTTTTANPTTADADGFFRVYLDPGRYNVTATYSGDTQTFNDVVAQENSPIVPVENVTALKAISPIDDYVVYLKGHTTVNDGGGGEFIGVTGAAAGTYTDDNGITILPTGGDGSAAWVRVLDGFVSPLFYGAPTDGSDAASHINAAIAYLSDGDGGTLRLDDGSAPKYNHASAIKILGENITVEGGKATLTATGDCWTWEVGVQTSFATTLTYYDITGSYTVGDRSVTLATPAQHTNFSVGDYIYMRCQQEVPTLTDQPVAELNLIEAINTSTGVITFRWPMTKDFTDDPAYPYGLAVANSIVRSGVEISGGTYINTYRRVFNSQHVINHKVHGTKQIGRGGMVTRGRFIDVYENTIKLTPDWSAAIWRPYFWAVDTGTSDASFRKNRCDSSGTAIVHIQEGLGNVSVTDNEFHMPSIEADPAAEGWALIPLTGQSWGTQISRNKIYNVPDYYAIRAFQNTIYSAGHRNLDVSENKIYGTVTADVGPGTAILLDLYCSGKVHGNVVAASVGGNSIKIDSPSVTVRNNSVTAGTASIVSTMPSENVTGNDGIEVKDVYIPAGDMEPIAGTPVLTLFATGSRQAFAFDSAIAEYVSVTGIVPPDVTSATIKIFATNLGAGVGLVKWNAICGGFVAGEDTDISDATVTASTSSAIGQDVLYAITMPSFTVTSGDVYFIRVGRDAADAGDTLGNDAGIVGINVRYS